MNMRKNNRATMLCLALACYIPVSHAERADRDQPMHLEAARVSIDDAKKISTFEGKVILTQGTLTIRGDKIVLTQDKEGVQRGTATGKLAGFRQKREGFDEYMEGYGERIEYDSTNGTVDFFGRARMKRGGDEVQGDHISYSTTTEIFQAHGTPGQGAGTAGNSRVHAVIQPKKQPAPAATAGNPKGGP